MTVEEHLAFYCRLKGVTPEREKQEVASWLKRVTLSHAGHKYSKELSGGMRRRLSLAISMIGSPKLVFLDEPTTGPWRGNYANASLALHFERTIPSLHPISQCYVPKFS